MSIGRPKHDVWQKGFKLVKENHKYQAYCYVCNKTLQNTAKARLQAHRLVCILFYIIKYKCGRK